MTDTSHGAGGAAGPHPGLPLLATKLFVPRPRADLVARPRLLARLDDGLDGAAFTLLSAPAGAGKTSLLAAWVAELDRPVAWLTLDERDRDPHRFLQYLLAAVTAAVPGAAGVAWLDGPPPPVEAVLTGLVNEAAAAETSGVLVLDDYHVVNAPPVHEAVGFLLDHLPPTLHLVVASREDPPLPLPRLRARGRLVELRAGELGFTVAEAAAFLRVGMGLVLTDAQVAALVERTEGWAAGLQLAGLALRDRPDADGFVRAFAGGHRLVADYLSAEVLARQPAAVRRFLTATSVLDRFCAPLADAVLAERAGADGAGAGGAGAGGAILAELERANLFLVALDDDRTWYRYHHLFADTLRARLAREAGPAEVAALHRRASAWFGAAGLLPEAIQHALVADAHPDAVAWLEALAPATLGSVDVHRAMEDWLAAMPDALVRTRPMLCLVHAWLLIHHLQMAEAEAWTDAADRARPDGDTPEARRVRGSVAAVRGLLAILGPDAAPERAISCTGQALADLPPADVAFRGVAAVAHAQAALALRRPDEAERVLAVSAEEGREAGLVHGALVVAGHLVAVQRLRGARLRALDTGRTALAWAGDRGRAAHGFGMLSALVADLLADGNDLDEAMPLMVEGHRVVSRFRERPPLVLLASLGLARLHLYAGRPDAAADVLAQVRPLVGHGPFTALAPMLAAGDALVQFARGDASAAVAWAVAARGTLPAPFRLQTHVFAGGMATLLLAPAHILVTHGRAVQDDGLLRRAAGALEHAEDQADRTGSGWLRLRVAILRALVADGLGDRDTARTCLAAAVAEAGPEGVVRPFVDGGAPVLALLADLRAGTADPPTAAFLERLCAAFPEARPSRPGTADPLTARELDVLRLLAAGRSNAGMARLLTVELSTVKTHLVHVYDKLGVHSRTAAVARARALDLID